MGMREVARKREEERKTGRERCINFMLIRKDHLVCFPLMQLACNTGNTGASPPSGV